MPRKVSEAEEQFLIMLIRSGVAQRDIERDYGASRTFLRKLAKKIGYQFPRNGIENVGQVCMCASCGRLFRRPRSKVERAKYNLCSDVCRVDYMRADKAGAWKDGSSVRSFSSWIVNQQGYEDWRKAVLERYNYKCAISGRDYDLHCHHIEFKGKEENYGKALDVDNGIILNEEIHKEIHKLAREGLTFEEACEKLKKKYSKENQNG